LVIVLPLIHSHDSAKHSVDVLRRNIGHGGESGKGIAVRNLVRQPAAGVREQTHFHSPALGRA
jgi:hypothetical protein